MENKIKIKIYKIEDLDKNLKATIHKTGKLGFTSNAANKLNLHINKSADIGYNETDLTDRNIYLIIRKLKKEGQFNIVKAGMYYYINAACLFDTLKIDYTGSSVSFDITPEKINGENIFVLKRRIK